jgi:hypothetical protein
MSKNLKAIAGLFVDMLWYFMITTALGGLGLLLLFIIMGWI